ncbi:MULTISPECIES: type-F conjugative transfer system protein TrbI [Enterobacteriaceae]|jgi:conjugal transfer pilin signal peptidase TrbI|uniref:type-F conjugative transfer system protein TrbI n=1 Tax=Enterobacteriaceae TaxID=543 RepID=UPI000493CCCA|nr:MULTISPECIES: type-F conjugative transfer system protein TrbI [Enterobacteriaceae]EKV6484696.1 type-F conjugative transfer system protein TrbI [Citrobacter freundii]HCR2161039.1 type-F conjugative transfer system protein TrbI [Enterobacter asburiae]KJX22085.1 conjugal transfer protein TrbI [Enterobacter hormaechei subsp. xiangfangensis]RMA79715.1 conjugal transfer pilin signal peptidase TrbI [Enterobacter sp. WP_7_1]RMA87548.1 conjugal transfer pilin signal peptidase TrbI [Enterobacter sp. 
MSEQQSKPYDGDTVRDGATMAGWLTSRRMKLAICVLVSQMVMTGITWIYMKTTEPEIVVFDMKGTVDLFMQQSAQLQLDENRAKAMTQQFNAALTGSLDAWQSSHNAIILVKPAVMSPQRDITNEIRADIARRTQGGQ